MEASPSRGPTAWDVCPHCRASEICDVVRDMFVCESMDDVAEVLGFIAAIPNIELLRFKNRNDNPSGGETPPSRAAASLLRAR